MAESSWPFDNQDTTEAQYSALMVRAVDTGVLGGPSGGELAAYADGSGMFVKVPAGDALVQGFYYRSDALTTLSVPAAGPTARVDSVVLRLDTASNRVYLAVKSGDVAAPPLTQTGTVWELRVADVAVAANATTIPGTSVTDRRSLSSSPWGRWSTDGRPTGAREGRAGYNVTLKLPEWWDGATWRPFGGTTTDASKLTAGTLATARLDYGVLAAVRGDRTVDAPMTVGQESNSVVNGDWNAVLQPGAYRIHGGYTNTNAPGGADLYGTLVVFGAGNAIQSRSQAYYSQKGGQWWRTAWNGNDWGAWQTSGGSVDGSAGIGYPGTARSVDPANPTLLVKTGRSVTLTVNVNLGNNGLSTNNTNPILTMPEGFKPVSTANPVMWSSTNVIVLMAVDKDGGLRVRNGSLPANASLYGQVPWTTAS